MSSDLKADILAAKQMKQECCKRIPANEHPFYPAGVQIKVFCLPRFSNNTDEINAFLLEYEGYILDIQFFGYPYDRPSVMIVYRAFE